MSKEKASTSERRLEELHEGTLEAPKDSELSLTLGEAFLRVNRVDEAAASYQRAVELDPRSDLKALYWEWLGLVREMEGRLEEALEAYFQWLDADPVAVGPLDRLGTLLVVLGRWTDVRLLRPQFDRRVEVSPDLQAKESLALYTFVTEQFAEHEDAAKEATLAALELDADSPSMRFLLGLLTYRDGGIELARAEFERVLELDREGLWHEPRFALDWNASKARVMVAKLARQQGDVETALHLLTEADDLDQSDSEGLIEVASLLVENHRYDELLKLMKHIPPGPSLLSRLEAESLLGKGRLTEATQIIKAEAELFSSEGTSKAVSSEARFAALLGQTWSLAMRGEDVASQLTSLRRENPDAVETHPVGSCLILLHRFQSGSLGTKGVEAELASLCSNFPECEEVWETACRLSWNLGDRAASQLASLMSSKVRHGSRPGPTGSYTSRGAKGTKVLVGVVTDLGPLVLKLEADIGREETDQLFGWGRGVLLPGLELAKSVLENLAENRGHAPGLVPELAFFPRSFRVMITPVSVPSQPGAATLLADGELGSLPLGFLVALLSVLKQPPKQQILVMGRLGLRGDIDGVPELEETLMAVQQTGAQWDRLLLAEAGAFRLMRSPAWLWQSRRINLVHSASQIATWQSSSSSKESSES